MDPFKLSMFLSPYYLLSAHGLFLAVFVVGKWGSAAASSGKVSRSAIP